MIKLSAQRHSSFSALMKKLSVAGYIGALAFFAWVGLQAHLDAKNILSEKQIIEAELSLDDITETRRKRRTTYTYHFSYTFDVADVNYSSDFTTSENNAEKFIDEPTVTVVYKQSDPNIHDRLAVVERNASLGGVIKRLFIALPILALVFSAIYLLITQRLFTVRKEDE